MARSCAICGKVAMGGFNPQSSGMNRVRAHRRYQPNLQTLAVVEGGAGDAQAGLHALPADPDQEAPLSAAGSRPGRPPPARPGPLGATGPSRARCACPSAVRPSRGAGRLPLGRVEPDA